MDKVTLQPYLTMNYMAALVSIEVMVTYYILECLYCLVP